MALDNVLKIYDEQGNPVNYDILASDVKFQDGKDLPTKLAELEEEIGEDGYAPPAGGIPKTDLSSDVQTSLGKADSAYQKPASGIPATDLADGVIPDTSNLATKTELAAKVDKVTGYGLSKNDYTDADRAAVGTIGSKANDNVVVKSISVNGGEAQTPTNGNVNINMQSVSQIDPATASPSMDGTAAVGTSTKYAREDHVHPHDTSKQDALTYDNAPTANSNNMVKSGGIYTALQNLLSNITIGANGNWFVGSTDTNIKAQGPKGNSVADGDTFDIVNNLTDGGEEDALSAEMGKELYARVYNISNAIVEALRNVAYIGTNGNVLVNNIIAAINSSSVNIPVEQITLNTNSLTMNVGDTETLDATVLPAIATNKQLVWASSDSTIATVSGGLVTALQEGSVTITVTAADGSGVSASCSISVLENHVLYSLENEVFNGDKCIDTGLAMYRNYTQGGAAPEYSILFDAEFANDKTLVSNSYTLFHMMEEVSPWPGVCCQVSITAPFSFSMFSSNGNLTDKSYHQMCALVCNANGNFTIYKMENGTPVQIFSGQPSISAVNKNLLVGAYQQSNGTKGRYWYGTLNKFAVIDHAVTTQEIIDFFSE